MRTLVSVIFLMLAMDNTAFCYLQLKTRQQVRIFALLKSFMNGNLSSISLLAAKKMDGVIKEELINSQKAFKHKLLTANEECLLSRQFKVGRQIRAQKKIMQTNLDRKVSNEELAKVLGLASGDQVSFFVNRGEYSRKQLIEANLRLVYYICKYYRYLGVAYPDLVQEGTCGLMKAVDRYDAELRFRFSTYAIHWIRQSVSRAVAEKSRLVRLPVHIHDLVVSLERFQRHFFAQNTREPSLQELAERLSLPPHKVELLVRFSQMRILLLSSFDSAQYGDAFSENTFSAEYEEIFSDLIVSKNDQPTSLNEKSSIRSEFRRAIYDLPERDAQILNLRFGFADGNQMTLAEIGRQFSLSRERIRQIEARALHKLRSYFTSKEYSMNILV